MTTVRRVLGLLILALSLLAALPAAAQQTTVAVKDNTPDPSPDRIDYLLDEQPACGNYEVIWARVKVAKILSETGKKRGKVVLNLLILPDGTYKRYIVESATTPQMLKAVEEILPMLKFDPAIEQGQPVKCWFRLHFDFKTS